MNKFLTREVGLELQDYVSDVVGTVKSDELNKLIKKYGLDTLGMSSDQIKSHFIEVYGAFSNQKYNLNNFIYTCLKEGGNNITSDFLREFNINITVQQAVSFGIIMYYFEDELGYLEQIQEGTRTSAADIISNWG